MLERVWRKGNPLTLLVGMQTSTATMKNSVEIPLKTGNRKKRKKKRKKNNNNKNKIMSFKNKRNKDKYVYLQLKGHIFSLAKKNKYE